MIAGEQLHVLSGLTLLTDLNMKGCYRVADQGLACGASLAQLHRLNLQGCWQITASGLAHLSGMLHDVFEPSCFRDILKHPAHNTSMKLGLRLNPRICIYHVAPLQQALEMQHVVSVEELDFLNHKSQFLRSYLF